MVVWKTRCMEHTWSNMYTVYGMRRRRRKFFPMTKKKFPKPRFSGALELRGEGGRGVQGGGVPPPTGMKIKASPCPPPPCESNARILQCGGTYTHCCCYKDVVRARPQEGTSSDRCIVNTLAVR